VAKQPNKATVKLQEDLNALYKAGAIDLAEFTSIQADIVQLSRKQVENAAAYVAKLKESTAEQKKLTKGSEDLNTANEKLIDITSKLNEGISGNIEDFKTIGDESKKITDQMKQLAKEQLDGKKISQEQYDLYIKSADEAEQLANTMQKIANSPVAPVMQDLQNAADDAADSIQNAFESFPGGGMIFRALGGDKLKEQLNKATTEGISAMADSMAANPSASMTEHLSAGFGKFKQVLGGLPNIGMILGIGAAIIAAKALFSVFQEISGSAKELSKEAGITYTEAKRLNTEARKAQASFGNQLATMEDITAVQSELVQAMGSSALVSTEVAANVADTAKAFGVSAETAGKVTSELVKMGVSQQEAADIQLEANAMALKAGVNVAAVQQDIADNAQDAAKYFGGSGKALAKAAVEAAKMGVTLEQMVKTADGLLSIEDSLEKQFRAQAMTGRQLNFDKARELALMGDIEGAQREMLKQAGTIEEFNAMNVKQKEALADAMGMEVGDLQKSLTLQKMRGKLSEDELAAANGLNISAEKLAKMSPKEIQAEIAKKNAADKTAAAMESMKNTLINALQPAAEAFAGIFSALSPVFKILGVALKVAFAPITLIGNIVKEIMENFNNFIDLISGGGEDLSVMQKIMAVMAGLAAGIAASQLAYNAYKTISIALEGKSLAGMAASAASAAGTAVSMIFKAFASIPFGLGIPLAIAAVGGLIGLIAKAGGSAKKAGDVGIAPNGGPVVASPREGSIFQGTKNDGVEMSPTAGTPGGGGGGGGGSNYSSTDLQPIIDALNQILQGVNNPPPVVIGESAVSDIGSKISSAKSFIS
jgi:hypothetical protein